MLDDEPFVGSNSWAVAGTHAEGNAALLANDMHLSLRLPHIWYRARLIVESGSEAPRDLVGVTLPGLPMLIAGSNGHIAWGYTNSYGDWSDIVVVEPDPQDRGALPDRQRLRAVRESRRDAQGARRRRRRRWSCRARAGVRSSSTTRRAGRWCSRGPRTIRARRTCTCSTSRRRRTSTKRCSVANRAGGPVQNVLVADASGRIGWSLMGQVPVRASYDTTLPHSWREPGGGWTGWRTPEEYPRVVDPASGRLWTANARTIDVDTWLAFLGDGGYDLGARAAQIRDDLLALQTATRQGHARDPARRSRAVPHALARSVARRLLDEARARRSSAAQAGSTTDRALVRARCCRRRGLSHRARRALADSQGRFRIAHRARRASVSRRRSSRRRRSSKGRCGSS